MCMLRPLAPYLPVKNKSGPPDYHAFTSSPCCSTSSNEGALLLDYYDNIRFWTHLLAESD
jgi:hypothetical protein